jgi:release factor glutamine methyltransferase
MQNYWQNWDAMSNANIKHLLENATRLLSTNSPSPRLDAELLMLHTLNRPRVYLYAHPEAILTPAQWQQYQQLLEQRITGMPIAYLTQTREFWSLPLRVCQDTLIPRPETELLVELALGFLNDVSPANILDLGTGSGAVALALASERPDWRIMAVDKSAKALDVARDNAVRLGIHNLELLRSDWFEDIPLQSFNAIVSNPPYIADHDEHLNQGDVRFEPKEALVSGKDGLDALTHIIQHSFKRLKPNGLLLLEHGYTQGPAVTALLIKTGYQNVRCWPDAQGHDRISGGWCKNEL